MRIDKFLKVSRILKRRTVAKEICNSNRVLLNGKEAKPSKEITVGDTLEIHFGEKVLIAKVLSLDVPKGKDTSSMFELIAE